MPQRIPHNHILQIRPSKARHVVPDCPACSSIDPEHMDAWYAQAWNARIKADAEFERALRQ